MALNIDSPISSTNRTDQIRQLIRCPHCHCRLEWETEKVTCSKCNVPYPLKAGRPDFINAKVIETEDAEFHQEQMHKKSLRGRLLDLGQKIITSEYAPYDHRAAFLAEVPPDAIIVEFGSGKRRLTDNTINIDLFLFPNVDVAADIERAPFEDSSIDFAILDSVVEHVPNPAAVVEEIRRILKPGGKLLCINPFLFPYHGYPAHYCNFTRDGIQHLLRNFSSIKVEPHFGPTSAMINIFSEYIASGFAGQRRTPYLIIRAFTLLVIGWFRFFDYVLIRSPNAHRLAGMLCSIAIK